MWFLCKVLLANGLSLSSVGAVGSYVLLVNGLSLLGVGAVGSYLRLPSAQFLLVPTYHFFGVEVVVSQ